ncbi:hepatic lectin-like [Saccostrea cucullata]|uniref:hepatic lectin-like n=1 Tax=Saccostrea cuccullata TaxID=36930 RepID=UPI002ED40F13
MNRQCVQLFFSQREDNSYTDQTPQTSLDFVHFRKSCMPPWTEYNNHCYLKGQTKVTWAEAKAECEDMCSHLVVIDNMEESNWLAKAFLRENTCPTDIFADCTAWTGGNDLEVEGQYRWNNSNVTMTFTYWYYNEPSINDPTQAYTRDCIDLLKTAKWNDRPCSYLNSFICEKSYYI